jgi:predicted  nucleic acid-binding Zn-ribbon protein
MNNSGTARELLALKDKIENAKADKARVEGEIKSLHERMREDFGSDDPKAVKAKVAAMQEQAARLSRQVEEGMAVLRREMT